jgi:pullulanase/glycogen debranching enzyme
LPTVQQTVRIWEGTSTQQGATWDGLGVNFSLFSANATKVELCLFDETGTQELDQFRIFEVHDLVNNSEEARNFLLQLNQHATGSTKLLWVPFDQIIKGRAISGQVIAAHAAYLFGQVRYLEDGPAFLATR